MVSTANVALQDQIFSKDLPLLRKIIPELRFTAAFGRGRYVCPRNLAALASSEPTQQDLLAFLDDELTPNNKAEQEQCAKLKADLDSYRWDGLRDHTSQAIGDDLWRRLSTDKASCLNRNCHYYRECPFLSPGGDPGSGSGGRQSCAGDGGAGERGGAAGAEKPAAGA